MVIKLLWLGVFLLAALGVALLLVSMTAPPMGQVAVAAMVVGFIACAYVGMRAIEAMAAPSRRNDG
jgi:hypothetical protein